MNDACPSWLPDLAARVAASDGDEHPRSAEYVRATLGAAMAAKHAGWMNDDQEVYFTVLRGSFIHWNFRGQHGASAPRGTVVTFTVDPVTQGIYDYGIGDQLPDLATLGQVHSLARPEMG
jgi:hypothetical protein